MRMLYGLVIVASLSAGASSAAAQVTVEFQDGKVRLLAQSVSVSQILAEWARQGRTTIVNGERVPGPTVTLELQDVSEQQALDVVLRGVSGYLVAPRETAVVGASAFDRIYILPTSSRPTNASALPPQQQAVQPPIQDNLDDDNAPAPGVRGVVNNPGARLPRDIVQPGITGRPPGVEQDVDIDGPRPAPPPGNPFAPSTVRPGVVTPGTPSPTPPGALTPAVPAPNTPGMITPAPAPNNRPNNQ